MVSADTLHAVLLEHTDEGTKVRLKWSSSRGETSEADLPFSDTEEPTPGVEDEPEDVTIEFGDEGGEDDLFLGSEFEDLEESGDEFSPSEDVVEAWNFQAQLDALLDECAEAGFEDPEIAFCESTADIDEVELRLPEDESGPEDEGDRGLPLPRSRSKLLEMLDEQYEGGVEGDRVGFIPMHRTGDDRLRVLALISRPGGPVQTTLSAMQGQTLARSPRTGLVDAETSLYLGLARSVLQLPPDTPEKTVLVRSGPEDTLVLFIEGNTLRQSEHLPELTSEDSAETICSRVLLLQDEYGMGEVQHLILVAEENESLLADAFKSYFASASLRLLRNHLPNGEVPESSAYIGATGVALRLLDDPDYEPFFQEIDLLPDKFTASRFRLPVGWSVPALLGLLVVTTLGFTWYYYSNAQEIGSKRAELQNLERQVEQVDQQALQRRIDSMQQAAAEYSRGLEVVNRLLQGSNKWSRQLATVTGRINEIEGISIDEWSPQSDTTVQLAGRSTTRPRVVNLAEDLVGEINSLSFVKTRDVQLYEFDLTVPLDTSKPEAISYWRKQQLADASSTEATEEVPADSTSPPPADALADASGGEESGAINDDTGAVTANSSSSETGETENASRVWTVVVASLARDEDARIVARRYRERLDGLEHKVHVQHGAGNDRYRVGVGVFSTFEAARDALQQMKGDVPQKAWLHLYSPRDEQTAREQDFAREGAASRR